MLCFDLRKAQRVDSLGLPICAQLEVAIGWNEGNCPIPVETAQTDALVKADVLERHFAPALTTPAHVERPTSHGPRLLHLATPLL